MRGARGCRPARRALRTALAGLVALRGIVKKLGSWKINISFHIYDT
jgi:hypothetical protein